MTEPATSRLDVLGDTGDWSPEMFAYLSGIAEKVGRNVARSFATVDSEDLVQAALVWAITRPGALNRFLAHEDEDACTRMITRAMKEAAREYAFKEQALSRGDVELSDDVFYSTEMLKGFGRGAGQVGLLHCVFDDDAWLSPPQTDDPGVRTKKDPAEGSTWLATLSDVSAALHKLSLNDPVAHAVLVLHYKQGYTYDAIGASLTPPASKVTVSRKIDRAVRKLQEVLGGPRPREEPPERGWENGLVGTRRAISNAAARAITRNEYADD